MKFLQLINHLYRHGYKSLYPVISSDMYSLSDYNLAENVMLGALCGNGEIIYKIKSNKIWHLKTEIFPSKHSLLPFPSFIFRHKPYRFLTGYLFYILSFLVCVLMLKAGILLFCSLLNSQWTGQCLTYSRGSHKYLPNEWMSTLMLSKGNKNHLN